ncbi:MAG: transposase [Spirochaetes bacterium]|nr:transposase [Spirochaetota bacterium]
MSRRPRIIGPQLYNHIYAWGNDRHPIFRNASNRKFYLSLLDLYAARYKIDIVAYALMDWHIHLFLFDYLGELSSFMNSLHGRYAQYFNAITGRRGHVFGERFNNKIVQSNKYGVWLSRYIHRQPIEAGISNDLETFPWTSYLTYVGKKRSPFLKPGVILNQFGRGENSHKRYERFVRDPIEPPFDCDIKKSSIIDGHAFADTASKSAGDTARLQSITDEKLLRYLCDRLGCTTETLVYPHRHAEHRCRHAAFQIMREEYRLSLRKIARLCNVTHTTVHKALTQL